MPAPEIRSLARPLTSPHDLDPLIGRIGAARYVGIGEASHGTQEYYRWRAELSRRLIEERDFTWIGVEGDWPDCWRINRWVRGHADQDLDVFELLARFERWPTWMWANQEVAEFLAWLRPLAPFVRQDGDMTTFDAASTTEDVLEGIDLTGKTILVTGTSAGLGVEAARALVAHGARVIGAVRDPSKATTNLDAAGADLDRVELRSIDLASLASVRAFTDGVVADHEHLDAIIANAGIMACPRGTTADGFETQFGTNHLGHFVLVNRLVPLLDDGGRIVALSSSGHRLADVDLDDPNFEHTPYDAWMSYGRAKTANVLFAVELDRRLRDRGIRATAVHPGGILTELGRHLTEETFGELIERHEHNPVEFKTVPQGAATEVWAAVVADADEVGGRYCEDCAVAPVVEAGSPDPGVYAYALDPDRATALWARSEELVGETFTP